MSNATDKAREIIRLGCTVANQMAVPNDRLDRALMVALAALDHIDALEALVGEFGFESDCPYHAVKREFKEAINGPD